ncbi:MAG TPA: hypothetical protein VFO16_12860 [Pseudonocardiaceae bacterium]|nr:hypothetical protein [Pseudonocardiaceae bacterium]
MRARWTIRLYAPLVQPAAPGPSALEWVSAVAQIAGAFGTLAAVVVALWVASRDGRRLRAELSDREKGQARLIFADVCKDDGRWLVRTTNHSAAPVFIVEVVEVRHRGGMSAVEDTPEAPAVLDVLEPGQIRDRVITPGGEPSSGVVVLRYLDATGLRWRREGTRQPERIVE